MTTAGWPWRLAWPLVMLVAVGLLSAGAAAAADPAPVLPDTLTARVHTATADGAVIDAPAYPSATDVHLVARTCEREEWPLAAGVYVFAVFDAAGHVLSSAPLAERRLEVDAFGRIVAAATGASATRTICPGNGAAFLAIAVTPFAAEAAARTDPFWLRVATATSVDTCLETGEASGFGCDEVERTSVAFTVDPAASPVPDPLGGTGPAATVSGSPQSSGSATPSRDPATPDEASSAPTTSPDAAAVPSGDLTAAPTPSDAVPAEEPPASPSASPSASPPASPSASPPASPPASPSASPPASPSASPSASPPASPPGSPAPSATGPPPSGSPEPSADEPPGPSASPSAGGRPVTVPTPPRVANPGEGATWTPPAQPTPAPFSLPPGAYVCPGQLITPSGCQPIDTPADPAAGITPAPSWSWGPVPSGVPVSLGSSAPADTRPPAVPGGPSREPAGRGALPGPGSSPPGEPAAASAVGISTDLLGTLPRAPGTDGVPDPSSPEASGPDGLRGAVAGTSDEPLPTGSWVAVGTRGAAAGAAAGAAGSSRGGAPRQTPAGVGAEPPPPALPLLIGIVLLLLSGGLVAAAAGWARRSAVRRSLGGGETSEGPLAGLVGGMRHRPGRPADRPRHEV